MAAIDACYSDRYAPYPFIVDTDSGARLVQELIDPEAVSAIPGQLGLSGAVVDRRVRVLYRWVLENCRYTAGPRRWPTVAETLQTRRGDCKGLSLLLLSLLLCADVPAHAAVANGHMWVNVYQDSRLQVLELDQDPRRQRIYRIPGFYRKPLYRIYADLTLKRQRIAPSGAGQREPAPEPPEILAPGCGRSPKVP
jgi:transglutaminase-like putative cysteine protease